MTDCCTKTKSFVTIERSVIAKKIPVSRTRMTE